MKTRMYWWCFKWRDWSSVFCVGYRSMFHIPLKWFRLPVPVRIDGFFWRRLSTSISWWTWTFSLQKILLQLSSQSWPTESKVELSKFGIICDFYALDDNCVERERFACSLDIDVHESVMVIVGPIAVVNSVATFLSFGQRYWWEASVSNVVGIHCPTSGELCCGGFTDDTLFKLLFKIDLNLEYLLFKTVKLLRCILASVHSTCYFSGIVMMTFFLLRHSPDLWPHIP